MKFHLISVLIVLILLASCSDNISREDQAVSKKQIYFDRDCDNKNISFVTDYNIKIKSPSTGTTGTSTSYKDIYAYFTFNDTVYVLYIGTIGSAASRYYPIGKEYYAYYDGSSVYVNATTRTPVEFFRQRYGRELNVSGTFHCKWNLGKFSTNGLNFSLGDFNRSIEDKKFAFEYCSLFVQNFRSGSLKDKCLLYYYNKTKDIIFCRNMEQLNYACILKLVILDKDLNYCYKVKHKGECFFIFANISKDIQVCDKCDDDLCRESCKFLYILENLNYEDCELLNNEIGKKYDYLYKCYINFTLINQDEKLCTRIEDDLNKWRCFEKLALKTHDETLCDKSKDIFPTNVALRNLGRRCVNNVAVAKRDISLCFTEENTLGDSECIDNIAVDSKDSEFCDYINYEKGRFLCLWHVAKEVGDISICNEIKNIELYDFCIKDVVTEFKLNRSEACDQIQDEYLNYLCLSDVAFNSNNYDFCFKIEDESKREVCLSKMAIKLNNVDLCIMISDSDLHCYCILQLADKNSNVSICDFMIKESNTCSKKSCIDLYPFIRFDS